MICSCCGLLVLMFFVPVNNFSVMLGQFPIFQGWMQRIKMCPCLDTRQLGHPPLSTGSTQEVKTMALHDRKIVDWGVKHQHKRWKGAVSTLFIWIHHRDGKFLILIRLVCLIRFDSLRPDNIFQLCQDGSSWVEPVLSKSCSRKQCSDADEARTCNPSVLSQVLYH